jgi:excisionase family DNA binding protein
MTNDHLRQMDSSRWSASVSLLGAQERALILGVSVKTVHKLVREGRLPCVQVTDRERRFMKREYVR